jgi:hypothetical protein
MRATDAAGARASTATLQAACRLAAREADLGKPVTVHTLRYGNHCLNYLFIN